MWKILAPEKTPHSFGTVAGFATGIPLAAAGVDSRIAVPAALGAAALAAGVSYVIAKHQASERQRQIAEQRARLYMAQRAAARTTDSENGFYSQASGTKKAKSPKETRYIAVKTEKRVLQ